MNIPRDKWFALHNLIFNARRDVIYTTSSFGVFFTQNFKSRIFYERRLEWLRRYKLDKVRGGLL